MMLLFAKFPRKSLVDPPTWGIVKDTYVMSQNRKKIETWVVYPQSVSENGDEKSFIKPDKTVILVHGNSRNRDRMVKRSKIFTDLGYTTILFSVRSHGNSDGDWFGASVVQFAQDLNSVINWWGKPVIVYGHSLGGGAGLITAARNPLVKGLITDATPSEYPYDLKYALRPVFGKLTWFFLPGSKFALRIYNWKYTKEDYDPGYSARNLKIPVLIFHGVHDHIYPPVCAEKLNQFIDNSELHIFEKANHSTVHEQPEFNSIIEQFLITVVL